METKTKKIPKVQFVELITEDMILIQDAGVKLRLFDKECRSLHLLFEAGLTKVMCEGFVYFYKNELAQHMGITEAQLEEGFLTSKKACQFLGCGKHILNKLTELGMLPKPYRVHQLNQTERFQWSQDLYLKSELIQAHTQFFRISVNKSRFLEIIGLTKVWKKTLSSQMNVFFDKGQLRKRSYDILKGKLVHWKGNQELSEEFNVCTETIRKDFNKTYSGFLRFVKECMEIQGEKLELLKRIKALERENLLLKKAE